LQVGCRHAGAFFLDLVQGIRRGAWPIRTPAPVDVDPLQRQVTLHCPGRFPRRHALLSERLVTLPGCRLHPEHQWPDWQPAEEGSSLAGSRRIRRHRLRLPSECRWWAMLAAGLVAALPRAAGLRRAGSDRARQSWQRQAQTQFPAVVSIKTNGASIPFAGQPTPWASSCDATDGGASSHSIFTPSQALARLRSLVADHLGSVIGPGCMVDSWYRKRGRDSR